MITYRINEKPDTSLVIDLYRDSGLPRPIDDAGRIQRMYENSNLVISAWDEDKLVGVSRALSDFSFCCYLSDLAVKKNYQQHGIGKELVTLTKKHAGPESMLLLLSVPGAMEYYPRIGMNKVQNGFIIFREH